MTQGSADDASAGLNAAVELFRRQARNAAPGRRPALLYAFGGLLTFLSTLGRWEEVLAVHREIINLLRLREVPGKAGNLVDSVGVLGTTSIILVRLGRWEEAVAALGETAKELAARSEGGIEYCIRSTLETVTANVAALGPDDGTTDSFQRMARDEAMRVLDQFAETYRRLARDDPATHEPGLAATLRILSEALWVLGRSEDSLAAGREAVELRRRLAENGTPEHQDHLALALKALAEKLTNLGQPEQAAAAAAEAADIRRRLARDDPARHERALAVALHLVAGNLRRLRPEEAVAPGREAVMIVSRLARDDPAEHESALAAMLDNTTGILRQLGREEEAAALYRQVTGPSR